MISDFSQSILYYCPNCSAVSERRITAFQFPKNKAVEISCTNDMCSIPVITVKSIKDKYKISIVCPICSETHSFTISSKTLWNKEFFILNCNNTGMGILFVGKNSEKLSSEYQAQIDMVSGLMAEEDFDEDELDLLFEIFERINELARKESISCSCGSSNIAIQLNADSISLTCKNCDNEINFDIDSELLDKLLSTNHFII